MIKKIKSGELKPGMYIHDLNCGWLDHPFFGRSMDIKDDEMIEKIVKYGIREVYIDTDRGLDVSSAPTKEEVDQEIQEEIEKVDEMDFGVIQPVSINEEMLRARKVKQEAMNTVQNVMCNIKVGKHFEREAVEHIVDDIIVSILRNPDALIGLGRLRRTDEYVYNHSISVCVLMVSFGKHLGFDSQLLKEVGLGAMLHDIGTMKVPEQILSKKGALTDDEYEDIKKHVDYGRILLEETEGVTDISIVTAYQHHERLDGTGYPNGLKGNEITYAGQALAIVDVYDALTTKRVNRRKVPPTQALKMLYEWSGTQFSKELVQKFIRCIGIYPVGSLVRLESGLLGFVIDHGDSHLLQPVVRIVYNTKTGRLIPIPYDVDLSIGGADRIISYEQPEKWDILMEAYF
jgi:HD-GYP domain-containing protein (c-di-GMP phosphodiesterase class II)